MKRPNILKFHIPGKGFIALVKGILLRCLRGRPKLTFAILAADTLSVIGRISAVLILSVMASVMKNDGLLKFKSYEVFLSENLFVQGLIGASAMIGCLLLSALFGFAAVLLARKMARWMNEQAIDDIMSGLAQSPDIAVQAPYTDPDIFNRLLTQNAIHYGMISETLLRMANPIVMFALAWVVVFIQAPTLAIGIIVFVILFSPIFLRLFIKTQRVAQDFYADSATTMGQGISTAVLSLVPQYGVFFGPHQEKMVKQHPYMRNFLDALDNNILANERVGLLVGVIGALFIGFVIGVNSYLASLEAINIGGIIALTGGFLYLVASARTVSSLLTNLVRFYPQVRSVNDFAQPLKSPPVAKTNIALPEALLIKSDKVKLRLVKGGERVGLISPYPLSKFTLEKFLTPIITPGGNIETLSRNLAFVSARYRYKVGETITINLNAGRVEYSQNAVEIAQAMGVLAEFEALPQGLSTQMTESVFKTLSGTARTALRLIPLMANPESRLVLIDVAAVRNLNPTTFDAVFSHMKNSMILIIMPDNDCPKNLVETFILTDGERVLDIGDREWLSQQKIKSGLTKVADDTVVYL